MSLISILFLGIPPAGLLMWVGNLVRTRGVDEKAGMRWLLFLLGGFGSSIGTIVIANLISDFAFSMSAPVLLPIMFGFTAALSLHLAQDRDIGTTMAVLFSIIIILFLSWIVLSNNWMVLLLTILVASLTAFAWLVWDRNDKWHLILFTLEVILLRVSLRVTDMNRISDMTPNWLASFISFGTYLFIPWAGIVLTALLIRRLLSKDQLLNWRAVTSTLVMVAVLFLMIGYQAVLVSMWDVATDGLGWIFLWLTTSTIGIGSAMLMTWSMPRRQLWAAILFALTVPLVLLEARNLGTYDKDRKWGTTPIITTEQRASSIDKAIQQYFERNNEYPEALSDLTPRYLLYIPNPYIIPGLDWCYEGGADHYRFGYVYRQYFSTPASVRVHSSAGGPFDTDWGCEEEAEIYSAPPGF